MSSGPIKESRAPRCEFCLPLRLDDKEFGGREVATEDGKRFVNFEPDGENTIEVHLGPDEGKRIDVWSQDCIKDSFPHLSRLTASSQNGCTFCAFLRGLLLSDDVTFIISDLIRDYDENIEIGVELFLFYASEILSGRTKFKKLRFGAFLDRFDLESEEKGGYKVLDIFCSITQPPNTTHDDKVTTWLGLEPAANDSTVYPTVAIEWAKNLLAACDNHIYCGRLTDYGIIDRSFIPTRLVEIHGTLDTLRLITREQLQSQTRPLRYTALSYCWGKSSEETPQYMTTSKNEDKRKNGELHISDLPATLQDAIIVTKGLSISYIWIDALCILQDRNPDWVQESSQLMKIYGSAYVTICSLTPSCDISFLWPQPHPTVEVDFQSTLDSNIYGTYSVSYLNLSTKGIGRETYGCLEPDNRWHSRGWTFVERYSSSRMLLINLPFIGFSCHTFQEIFGQSRERVNDYPNIGDLIPANSSFSVSSLGRIPNRDYKEEVYKQDLYDRWLDLVGQYSNRVFTFPGDMLAALSSIARFWADNLKDRYVAGIWESDLVRGLRWNLSQGHANMPFSLDELLRRCNSEDEYTAPSWSWARHRLLSWI